MDEDLMAALEAATAAAAAHASREKMLQEEQGNPLLENSQPGGPSQQDGPPLEEPKPDETVVTAIKSEIQPKSEPTSPKAAPLSPLKRSRSPDDEDAQRADKRQKTDGDLQPDFAQPEAENGVTDMSDIIKMIELAQQSTTKPEDNHDQSATEVGDNLNESADVLDYQLDINGLMASINDSLESGGVHHDILSDGLPSQNLPMAVQSVPKKTIWSNPAQYTRQTHALPGLGRAAVDILRTLSENSLEDTIGTLNDPDSEIAKEYVSLRSFFDVMRKQFSDDFPLLYADQLDMTSTEDREIIRIANLATTCASMFGTNELGFPDLESNFIHTFVPTGQHMSADVADLFLGLKTQMFLTLLEGEQTKSRQQLLDDLFVSRQEKSLRDYHPNLPLTTSETEFLANAQARKAMLLNESGDPANIQALSQQYIYESYLDAVSTWLNDNMTNIERLGSGPTSSSNGTEGLSLFDGANAGLDGEFDIDAAIAAASQAALDAAGGGSHSANHNEGLAALISNIAEQGAGQPGNTALPSTVLSSNANAIQARDLALQMVQQNQYHPTSVPNANIPSASAQQPTNQGHPVTQQQQQLYQYSQQAGTNPQQTNQSADGLDLPPGQSHSSELLYEKARQAAAARSSTHARREGSHSTRRPWSPEEEKALMMGLDMVKGPHWSQILGLFGPQGRISNILADRTQVQLKDKARNLKLFFLKTNSEMPYYLQCVTGELKTRAPTQAARKEAEERARINSEGDKAHINGIMALGNLQNGSSQRPQPSTSTPKASTPAQAPPRSHSHPTASQLQHPQQAPSQNAQTTSAMQSSHLPQGTQRPLQQPQQAGQQAPQVRPPQQGPNHQPPADLSITPSQLRQPGPQHNGTNQQPVPTAPMRPQIQNEAPKPLREQSQSQQRPLPDEIAKSKSVPAEVKHEPEEAGILELKRLIDQEAHAGSSSATPTTTAGS